MEPARAAQALADASSALVRPYDVAGSLSALLESCKHGLDVDAGGVLVEADGGLELLAASSHTATELEVHQLHEHEGPCFDAHGSGESVSLHSAETLLDRWPDFGHSMLGAGFQSVHAAPLIWRGKVFGAMGLFRRADIEFTDAEDSVAQAFADLATMLLVQMKGLDPAQLTQHLAEALETRVLIEQAKGVLADEHDLSMADAYELLVKSAIDRRQPLTEWASRIISDSQARR